MQKIELLFASRRITAHRKSRRFFEWFDLMRNPTDALSRPDLEINLEHHRVF